MSVRGTIKKRMAFLSEVGREAVKKEDQATAMDCMIRQKELEWLLKEMRKK